MKNLRLATLLILAVSLPVSAWGAACVEVAGVQTCDTQAARNMNPSKPAGMTLYPNCGVTAGVPPAVVGGEMWCGDVDNRCGDPNTDYACQSPTGDLAHLATINTHAARHSNGGADEVDVANLACSHCVDPNDVVGITGASSGILTTESNTFTASWPIKPILIHTGAWVVDGAQCVKATEQLNSGPFKSTVTCADHADGRFDFGVERMPEEWSSGETTINLLFTSWQAAGSGTLALDLYCHCRTGDDPENNTWGIKKDADIVHGVANDRVHTQALGVFIDGPCNSGDSLSCYTVVDTTNTTVADIKLLSVSVLYPTDQLGE
jgi:hypothetical protein